MIRRKINHLKILPLEYPLAAKGLYVANSGHKKHPRNELSSPLRFKVKTAQDQIISLLLLNHKRIVQDARKVVGAGAFRQRYYGI